MTSEDIIPDRISKANIIDLINAGKDATEIVELWGKANPIRLVGSWNLTDEEIKHIIDQLEDFVKLKTRHNKAVASRADEIGEERDATRAAESRAKEAESSRDLYRKTLISVLKEVAMSRLPRSVARQIINRVLADVDDLSNEAPTDLIPVEYGETRDVTSVGSIVCAGERIILDKSYSVGVKGAFTEFGKLVISWDHSESADSCRAMGNENALTISLCDGSSEGDISSRIFSRLLTVILSEMVPLSEKSMRLLIDKPMSRFLLDRIIHENECGEIVPGRVLRDLSRRDSQEAIQELRAAGATAVNVIVHRTGWCWSSGVGDSALYLIRNGEPVQPLILDQEHLEDAETNLIRLRSPVRVEQGRMEQLQEGDVLIGVTDFVAEYIEANRNRLLGIVSNCKGVSSPRQPSYWQDLFRDINDSLDGNDDMTIFVYVHGSEALSFDSMSSGYSVSNRTYTVGPHQYESFKKDYYVNLAEEGGAKRITDHKIASNLRIIQEKLQQSIWPDFLPRYKIVQAGSDYFLLMEHFGDGYIRLDKLIEESDSDGLIRVLELLIRIENRMKDCEISHGDFSPTNIIIHQNTFEFKLLDLNTLYVQGCFPHDENGHEGMYGEEGWPCIPSLYSHIFPLRSIRLSVELMLSRIQSGQATKGMDCFTPGTDEEYILNSEKLRDYFLDHKGARLDEHTDELKSQFPEMDEGRIRDQLSSLRITEIYNFDSWGYRSKIDGRNTG